MANPDHIIIGSPECNPASLMCKALEQATMSNVSNTHSVIPFVAGESEALSGQRLIKIRFNETKKKAAEFPSVCVSVPPVPMDWVSDTRFHPYFVECLEKIQDNVAKSLYVSRKGKMEYLSDSDIGPDALVGYLVAESASSRVSADSVGAWFDTYVKDGLMVRIAEILRYIPTDADGDSIELSEDQIDTIEAKILPYRNIFQLIASKEIQYSPEQKHAINRCFELASINPSDSPMGSKIWEKYQAQVKAPSLALLENL